MQAWIVFGISLLLGIVLIPTVRWVSLRSGWVSAPREDRWHKQPTPVFGGVAIFIAFMGAYGYALVAYGLKPHWGILAAAGLMFVLGLTDDIFDLSPPIKLLGQILAAMIVVFSGYVTGFFGASILNILVSIVWIIGIINAINLIDNMDGLSGGISLIAVAFLAYFFWRGTQFIPNLQPFVFLTMALGGALLAFLLFNFPPASIFMGDSGSLFIGCLLATLAIANKPSASNILAVTGVPILILVMPILDTALVTFTRLLRGQSPAVGGRDHTSHRLIAFGLSEKQTLFVLYTVAIVAGVLGAIVEAVDYKLSLFLLPLVVVSLAFMVTFIAKIKVVEKTSTHRTGRTRILTNFLQEVTYRRRMLEIGLDFFVLIIVYYAAFWVRDGFDIQNIAINQYFSSLPVAIIVTYLVFGFGGVYKSVSRFYGLGDLFRLARATLFSVAITMLAYWGLFGFSSGVAGLLLLYGVFLFLGVAATRVLLKTIEQVYVRGLNENHLAGQQMAVLIFGADDFGEIILRWILQNPDSAYRVVGFLDADSYIGGSQIHGVDVFSLGDAETLTKLVTEQAIGGVLIPDGYLPERGLPSPQEIARQTGVAVYRVRLEVAQV